jgi:tRNA(Ile)-lysidine synthase TilS/MesJ
MISVFSGGKDSVFLLLSLLLRIIGVDLLASSFHGEIILNNPHIAMIKIIANFQADRILVEAAQFFFCKIF